MAFNDSCNVQNLNIYIPDEEMLGLPQGGSAVEERAGDGGGPKGWTCPQLVFIVVSVDSANQPHKI